MTKRYSDAKAFILDLLRRELPANCYYHSFEHTLDMHDAAERIAVYERLQDTDKEIVLIAALFHDAGFIVQADHHEDHSCTIARQALSQFGFSELEVESVCHLIMATQMPVNPKNKLEEIICDADLDYLGRDDFKSIGDLLYRELMERGSIKGEEEWNQLQIRFLTNHCYFTQYSLLHREAGKQENLKKLMGG